MTRRHRNVGRIVAPESGLDVPRYAGRRTFGRLPEPEDVEAFDCAIVGVPFDGGTTYRPGARFGPDAIRAASKLYRGYSQELAVAPFTTIQVVDAGDIACTPFDGAEAVRQIDEGVRAVAAGGEPVVLLGGDHTVLLGALRAIASVHGPVALVHFDAHLDTWDTYFGNPITHGSVLRRAAEEGLLVHGSCVHVGCRGTLYSERDLDEDAALGFSVIRADRFLDEGPDEVAQRIRSVVGDAPVHVSVDVDVLDPAYAPGTGTPEPGGLTSRELLRLVRSLRGLRLTSADIVEVSPAYDHAEITALSGAALAAELCGLVALDRAADPSRPRTSGGTSHD